MWSVHCCRAGERLLRYFLKKFRYSVKQNSDFKIVLQIGFVHTFSTKSMQIYNKYLSAVYCLVNIC